MHRFIYTALLVLLGTALGLAVPQPVEARGSAAAADTVTIRAVGSQLVYETTEIEAEAGTELTIRFVNEGAMPHNVVVLEADANVEEVGIAALQAQDTEYVPMSKEDQIVGYTEMAQPQETVSVTITVPPPGEYPYICTFPGHFRTMQGVLTSVE